MFDVPNSYQNDAVVDVPPVIPPTVEGWWMNEFSEIDGPKNLYTAVAQIFDVTKQRLKAIDPAIIGASRFSDSDYRIKKMMLSVYYVVRKQFTTRETINLWLNRFHYVSGKYYHLLKMPPPEAFPAEEPHAEDGFELLNDTTISKIIQSDLLDDHGVENDRWYLFFVLCYGLIPQIQGEKLYFNLNEELKIIPQAQAYCNQKILDLDHFDDQHNPVVRLVCVSGAALGHVALRNQQDYWRERLTFLADRHTTITTEVPVAIPRLVEAPLRVEDLPRAAKVGEIFERVRKVTGNKTPVTFTEYQRETERRKADTLSVWTKIVDTINREPEGEQVPLTKEMMEELYDADPKGALGTWIDHLPESARNITSLNLSYRKLKSVPPEISKFTQLKSLELNGNQLTELPKKIVDLRLLQVLNLSGNQFREPLLSMDDGNAEEWENVSGSEYSFHSCDTHFSDAGGAGVGILNEEGTLVDREFGSEDGFAVVEAVEEGGWVDVTQATPEDFVVENGYYVFHDEMLKAFASIADPVTREVMIGNLLPHHMGHFTFSEETGDFSITYEHPFIAKIGAIGQQGWKRVLQGNISIASTITGHFIDQGICFTNHSFLIKVPKFPNASLTKLEVTQNSEIEVTGAIGLSLLSKTFTSEQFVDTFQNLHWELPEE